MRFPTDLFPSVRVATQRLATAAVGLSFFVVVVPLRIRPSFLLMGSPGRPATHAHHLLISFDCVDDAHEPQRSLRATTKRLGKKMFSLGRGGALVPFHESLLTSHFDCLFIIIVFSISFSSFPFSSFFFIFFWLFAIIQRTIIGTLRDQVVKIEANNLQQSLALGYRNDWRNRRAEKRCTLVCFIITICIFSLVVLFLCRCLFFYFCRPLSRANGHLACLRAGYYLVMNW